MKKRMLCLVLAFCMTVTMLPTATFAAGKIIHPTANTLDALYNAFTQAQSGDTIQLTQDISTAAELLRRLPISRAVTLDLNGHTISYHGKGNNMNERSGLFYILNGGSLTITGETGRINLDQDYSALVQVNAGGKFIIESGTYAHAGGTDGCLITSAAGTVEIRGGTLSSKNDYVLALRNGALAVSGGTLTADSSYAMVLTNVAATVSGGTITGGAATPTAHLAAGSSLTMTGGELKNTGANIALYLNADCQPSTVSGGKISAAASYGIMAYSALTVSGAAEVTSTSSVAVRSDGTLRINGGTITAPNGMAVINNGDMSITGGAIHSGPSYGVYHMAPEGKTATIGGGRITSGSAYPVCSVGPGTLGISGGSMTTENGDCAVLNNGTGIISITGGTFAGKTTTLINTQTGTIKFSGSTINSILNYNVDGKIVIDGGSVKAVQGATPKNSAGTALRQYPVQITGKADTALADGELTFTPAVTYRFAGVTTDAASMVYLWLPDGLTSAAYHKDTIDLTGGVAKAGSTTVLPNFTATVSFRINDEAWTAYNAQVLLSEQSVGTRTVPRNPVASTRNTNGVYTFSGLEEGKTYYIWTKDILAYSCVGTAHPVKGGESVTLSYYTVDLRPGEGIDTLTAKITALAGENVSFTQTHLADCYSFKNWVHTGTDTVFSTETNLSIPKIDRAYDLTAIGRLDVYDATVTVNQDDQVWANHGKTIVLSPSGTKIDATGATGTLTGLDPRIPTYYVWVDGVYTGQTITQNSKTATVDYYTVTVAAKDATITSVTTSKALVLKGGEATIRATPADGKVFSRWQTDGGALYSADASTTISNITAPVKLTAVGAVEKFAASVTVNLDGGNNWTATVKHPTLVLSTSSTQCGAISGTYDNGVYTFANLSGVTDYYLWDADTMQLVSATAMSTAPITVDYYTVAVTDHDDHVSVTGGGVYLAGSTVTLTATPARYYSVLWNGVDTSATTYTINKIGAKTTVTVSAALLTYTGKVTVKRNGSAYTGATVELKTGGTTPAVVATTGAEGVYSSASPLDPTKEYAVWVNGADSGVKLTSTTRGAMLEYFTVTVNGANATVKAGEAAYTEPVPVLKGGSVTLTATPTSGYDFVNWTNHSGTVLSANAVFEVTNITEAQILTATASNTFDGVVIISGMTPSSIQLQAEGEAAKSTASTKSPYAFANLTRGKSYKVLINGEDTGKTIRSAAASTVLQYYSVALTAGQGIASVSPTAKTYYLAGTDVSISATVTGGYTFSKWNGADGLIGASDTISAISKDYTLTAAAYVPYAGAPFDLKNGQIVLEDDTNHTGQIKVTQGSSVTPGINPNATIVITGSSSVNEAILIKASLGATVQLKTVNISVSGESNYTALHITNTAGAVRLILDGANVLSAENTDNYSWNGSVALHKQNSALLTIQSVDGTTAHSLTATGNGIGSCGIGNYQGGGNAESITINSGKVSAGGALALGVFGESTTGITLNGGLLNAWMIGSGSNNGGTVSTITVNGGTLVWGDNAATRFFAKNVSNIIFTGGSIHATSAGTPTNGSAPLTMVTVTTGKASTDVSTMTITKSGDAGFVYGTNDMWTDTDGKLYLWLPDGSYTLTIGDFVSEITVPSSNSTTLTKKTYSANTPAAVTPYGVTFTSAVSPAASIEKGSAVAVTVALSGTAAKAGTYTLGLTGTGIGTVTAQVLAVTQQQNQSGNKTFTFTMPAADISDLALTVSFAEAPRHAVTYSAPDADGGSVPAGASYYEGQGFQVAGNTGSLTRTGYLFLGWSEDSTNIAGGSWSMPARDVNFAALWAANKYIVVFHGNGGTGGNMDNRQYTYDAAATLTANGFTRTGYTFAGWAESATGAKKYDDKAGVKNLSSTDGAEILLYALWKPNSYTVTFVGNGATAGEMTSQNFLHGAAQELNANTFTREGYTFSGWKKDASTSYANGERILVAASTTLTAQWTANDYAVKFDANGGTGTMPNQAFEYDTAQGLTKNAFTRIGYTFAGWATGATGTAVHTDAKNVTNLTAKQNDTVTLYAVWRANTYTVSFDKNAAGVAGNTADKQFTYDADAAALTANGFTRPGYTFGGWNKLANGTGTAYTGSAKVKNLTDAKNGAVTLYAVWSADIYTLTFAPGTGGNGAMIPQTFATGDATAIRPSAFTKAGYHFRGWEDDKGATVTTVDAVGRSATLTAQWTPNSYTVRFDSNGGSAAPSSQAFTYGEEKVLSSYSGNRSGFRFIGWAENPTATTETYQNSGSAQNLTSLQNGVVTLYAVWKFDTYAVAFDANGGEGNMQTLTITNGQTGTLPANGFTKNGCKFAGWNTQADGKGDYYPVGAAVSFTPDAAGRISLFAMWMQDVRYGISGAVTGGSGAALTLTQGKDVIATAKANAAGAYVMTDIAPGVYNLAAVKDGKTVTTLVLVTDQDVTADVSLPAANSSTLIIKADKDKDAPKVVVGGLDAVAEAKNASIELTVTAKAEDKKNEPQAAIMAEANGQKWEQFLDITLKKDGTAIDSTTPTVLDIVYPFASQGKTDITVWRYHGSAQKLTCLTARPNAPFADGTCFIDTQNGLIHIYASEFSTYAVSYRTIVSPYPYSVTVSPAENGTVKADRATATFGTRVTVTVTPAAGYALRSLAISEASGKDVAYTDQKNGTFTFAMPSSHVTVSAKFARQSGNPFLDVADDTYYYDAVLWAVGQGVTSGTSATTFSPDVTCTRAQAVTFLWRALGSPEPARAACPFTDVKADAYYHKAVLWATETGVTVGTSATSFTPNATVTRGQTVAFLWRAAGKPEQTAKNPFADVKSGAYYESAVLWAVNRKITQGTAAAAFSPSDGCTRAQIVTFLYRCHGNETTPGGAV